MVNTTVRGIWQLKNKYYQEYKNRSKVLTYRFLTLIPSANTRAFESTELTNNPKMLSL